MRTRACQPVPHVGARPTAGTGARRALACAVLALAAPVASAFDFPRGTTADIESGYDSRLYFRGLWLADHAVWSGLTVTVPLAPRLEANLQCLYLTTTDTPIDLPFAPGQVRYTSLDLNASLTYDAECFQVSAILSRFEYPHGFLGTASNAFGEFSPAGDLNASGATEAGLCLGGELFGFRAQAGAFFDLSAGGAYFALGIDRQFQILPWLSLVPAMQTGYGIDYYTGADNGVVAGATALAKERGFTHLELRLSAPIQMTRRATLTPYVAYMITGPARQALNFADSEMYGGVKITVAF